MVFVTVVGHRAGQIYMESDRLPRVCPFAALHMKSNTYRVPNEYQLVVPIPTKRHL